MFQKCFPVIVEADTEAVVCLQRNEDDLEHLFDTFQLLIKVVGDIKTFDFYAVVFVRLGVSFVSFSKKSSAGPLFFFALLI